MMRGQMPGILQRNRRRAQTINDDKNLADGGKI